MNKKTLLSRQATKRKIKRELAVIERNQIIKYMVRNLTKDKEVTLQNIILSGEAVRTTQMLTNLYTSVI